MRVLVTVVTVGTLLAACSPSGAAPASDSKDAESKVVEATQPVTPQEAVSAAEEEEAMRNVQTQLAYPAAFRGAWDWNREGCAKGTDSSTRFVIGENKITGYEHESTLLRIREESKDRINTTVHLESAAGEDTYEQIMTLSPVEGISMLVEADGESSRAYRCDGV